MRNFFLLALMGFSFLVTGCGAVRTVVNNLHHDTCVKSHNIFVCAAETTPSVPVAKPPRTCYGVAVRTPHGVDKIAHTNQGPFCASLQRETVRKAFKAKAGVNCYIEGEGGDQEVVCAALWPIFIPMVVGWLLQGLTPTLRRRVVVAAVIAAITLIAIHEANAGITCQKAVNLIEAKEKVMPAFALVLLKGCKIKETGSVKDLLANSDRLESAAKNIVTSAERYCGDSSVRGAGVVECFAKINQLAEIAKGKSLEASNLWLAAKEKADAERRAKAKAQQKAEIKALLKSGDKQVEEAKELIEAMQGLKLEEGSCGGLVFLFLFYFLLARLEGNRCVSVVVLAAMGCLVASFADAAICTSMEGASNKVAAQYGLKIYDCDDEVSQASKDAVFNVIYRGYVAQKGSLSEEYVKGRWARVEDAFWSVWGDAPLWQVKIAAAICSKEFLCGVQIKFSEWESKYWVGSRNNNGSVDCGITQINSGNTEFSCDELQDFTTAFKEQKRIIMLKVRGSSSKSTWRKRIHRYNGSGSKARQYGKKVWSWSGAGVAPAFLGLLLGWVRRRRESIAWVMGHTGVILLLVLPMVALVSCFDSFENDVGGIQERMRAINCSVESQQYICDGIEEPVYYRGRKIYNGNHTRYYKYQSVSTGEMYHPRHRPVCQELGERPFPPELLIELRNLEGARVRALEEGRNKVLGLMVLWILVALGLAWLYREEL